VAFRVAGALPFFADAAGFVAVVFPRGLDRTGTSVLTAGFLGVAELVGLLVLLAEK
jgi:hypothetical protein